MGNKNPSVGACLDINLIISSAVMAYRLHTDFGESVDDFVGDSPSYSYAFEGAVDYLYAVEGAGAAFVEEVFGVCGAGCDEGCVGGEGFVGFVRGGVVDCAEEEDFGFGCHDRKVWAIEGCEEE